MNCPVIRFVLCALIVCAASTAGADRSTPPNRPIPTTVIDRGLLMSEGAQTPGGLWITKVREFQVAMNRISRGNRIPHNGRAPLPEIDFTRQDVLVIWMGRRSTGGFGLDLIPDAAHIENRTLRISVRWIAPGRDSVVTQIITNPYLVIALCRGPYDTISVVDQNGVVRMTLDAHHSKGPDDSRHRTFNHKEDAK
jgi:hypothetical protein